MYIDYRRKDMSDSKDKKIAELEETNKKLLEQINSLSRDKASLIRTISILFGA